MVIIDQSARRVVELSTDDADDLEAVYAELHGTPGIVVQPVSAPMEPDEQGGVLDFLTVACSGGAVTVLLQIVKSLVESRDPHFVLKIRHGRDQVEIRAANLDEALPVIKEMIDGS